MSEGSGQSVARATAGGGPRPIFVPSLTASVKRQRCLLHLSEDVSLPLADYFMIILCRIGPVCFFFGECAESGSFMSKESVAHGEFITRSLEQLAL